MKEDKLEGWVFTKKEGIWYATIRDNYFALFNGINDKVICHKDRNIIENKINNLKTK